MIKNPHKIMIVLIVLVVIGLGGAWIYQITSHTMDSTKQETDISKSKNTTPTSDTYLLPYEENKKLSENEYEPYLAQKVTGLDEGGLSQNLGPVMLALREGGDMTKSVMLLAYIVPVPNALIDGKSQDIPAFTFSFSGAYNQKGENILEEEEIGKIRDMLSPRLISYPSDYIFGIGNGFYIDNILKSAPLGDLQKLEGTFTFRLRTDLEEFSISPNGSNIDERFGATVKSFTDNELVLSNQKSDEGYIFHVRLEDEAGDEIDTDISTSESDSAKTTTFTTADSGKSFHRALITAVRIVEKAYPFSLTPHESTPVEVKVRTVALNEEQKAVVDAFSEFKEIIDKKDIKAYLDYMEFVAPGSMEEAQKNKPGITEKEIEELVVSEMELLEFTLEDITTDMFSFANTQREFSKPDTNNEYKELTDYADVKIEITKEYEGSKNTYSFFKEAGKRYLSR